MHTILEQVLCWLASLGSSGDPVLCDAARITLVLKSYPPEDRAGLADPDGIIRARCEFCGKTHEITPDLLA